MDKVLAFSSPLNKLGASLQKGENGVALLRKGFKPTESKFRIWLQLHTDHNRNQIFSFWSSLLNIPTTQFMKPRITQKRGGKYRSVYYGTCSLRYNDYTVLLRLMGIYKRFAKKAIILQV